MNLVKTILALLTGLTLSSALFITADLETEKTSFEGNVTEVVDGDTVKITNSNGRETIRLLGVDTPETRNSNNPGEYGIADSLQNRECLKVWGLKAGKFLKSQVKNKTISAATDPESDLRGDYGRLLAYISTDNSSKSLNHVLVARGYARVYTSDFGRQEKFIEAQRTAKENNLGIWSCE